MLLLLVLLLLGQHLLVEVRLVQSGLGLVVVVRLASEWTLRVLGHAPINHTPVVTGADGPKVLPTVHPAGH